MSEDWAKVAAEVDEAIRSVGDVSQPGGYPVALRRPASGPPTSPIGPPTGSPTYHTLRAVETMRELRDASGTLTGQVRHTILVGTESGITPTDNDKVALGITAADASESSAWIAVLAVRPTAPAGRVVLWELDLET
ncbi:hypothetical protein [Amorphus sp. MBR-141]